MTLRLTFALWLLLATSTWADSLVLVAGGGDGDDGSPASAARLIEPFGVDFGADGTIYIVEMIHGERLRSINRSGVLTTLAGAMGDKGSTGDGGPARQARFNGMHSLAIGPDGDVYLADTMNNRVRKFDPRTGTVAAFAGTGEKGFGGDGGPARAARFAECYCIAFDPAGSGCYLTDLGNRRIRRVEMATGLITTVAGNGLRGKPVDGQPAVDQPLVDPRAHAIDGRHNLYILERGGHALRVVDGAGRIRTVAGSGTPGAGGTGGNALLAQMNGPKHLCVDRDGSVLIADTENHRILRYAPGGETLVVVAGTGKKGATGLGGDPRQAELNQPHGVIVHPRTGEIYISDASNARIVKIVKN